MDVHARNLGLVKTLKRYWTGIAVIALMVIFALSVAAIMAGDGSMRNNNDLASAEPQVGPLFQSTI